MEGKSMDNSIILEQYEKLSPLERQNNSGWLVRHKVSGKLYVMKKSSLASEEALSAAASLPSASGIVKIRCILRDADGITVIEDYIQGRTLEEILKDGPLSRKEAADIIASLCDILNILHQADPPIIHRDIKPSNVMISDDGVVKLIDLGAARLFSSEARSDTVRLGTEGYAAPEQFGFSQTDSRTDIYSLGILYRVLLTGSIDSSASVPPAEKKIIERCTRIDPADRYPNVQKLKKDIPSFPPEDKTSRAGIILSKLAAFAPPGFRTRTPWKMITAAFGYFLIAFFVITFQPTEGSLLFNRLYVALEAIFIICFVFDYRGLRSTMPFTTHSSRWVRILASSLWLAVGIVAIVVVLLCCSEILGIPF